MNGRPAVVLDVVKRSGENIINTIDRVRDIVNVEKENWPNGIEVNFILDESKTIKERLSDLQNNMISAVLLVMIVVVAALGLRAAGLVGVAIPGSFLTGVLVIYGTYR